MKSNRAQRIIKDAIESGARRAVGRLPSPLNLEAAKALHHNVMDVTALPANVSSANLQNSSGQNVMLMDYSAIDGPDVMG